jgi:hypothetical protein
LFSTLGRLPVVLFATVVKFIIVAVLAIAFHPPRAAVGAGWLTQMGEFFVLITVLGEG